jgi:hypothetical protein
MKGSTRAMASYNKVTKEKYDVIKILLKGGATVQEAADFVKLSTITVYAVRNSETFEEYEQIAVAKKIERKKRMAAMKAKEYEKKEEPKQEVKPEVKPEEPKPANPTVVKIEATHYMMQEMQRTNELLKGISAKLAFIVEELTGVKTNAEQDH